MAKNKLYLKSNRLADVLALIQVLAIDKEAHQRESELIAELQGNPKSANSWTEIAIEHRELFRFNEENQSKGKPPISLIARHVTEKENDIRVLPTEIIEQLFEIAIKLHDKEKERAERWKVWLPLLVAIITVVGSFYTQYTSNQNQAFLTHYEVELKPKQDSYANYMKAVAQSSHAAQANNSEQMVLSLDQAESSFYIFEPFLSSYDRDKIWKQYQQFKDLCYSVSQSDSLWKNQKKSTDSLSRYKNFFRTNLYTALFAQHKYNSFKKD